MATPQFVHLKVKSAYSLLDGAMTVKKINNIAKSRSLPALAICDNNLFGALEFSESLAASGVQPIIGLNVVIKAKIEEPEAHELKGRIALYAQNEIGFANICALSSATFLEIENIDDGIDIELIAELSDGLICLSGGFEGILNNAIIANDILGFDFLTHKLSNIFKDRFYIEIGRHGREDELQTENSLLEKAYELDIPIVGTNDVRYDKREKHYPHEVLTCINEGSRLSDNNRKRLTEEHYFKTDEEMIALFADLPECIENTVEIAKRCAIRAKKRKPILPSFPSGQGLSESEELAVQAREGLQERLSKRPPVTSVEEYNSRLEFELDIINRMGFSGYFLIVSDFIKWAKAHDIPVGPGRGSGAGSLVAYVLKITDLDPLEFGLLFERFLNPERISMPDFDIDFCQTRRDEVISYVQEKYGFERVSQIITFGTLQARAAVRDVGRVLDMSFNEVSEITKLIPNNPANPVTLAKALEIEPKLKEKYDTNELHRGLLDTALELEGLYRNCSTHAAGVVIAGRPLKELVPLYKDPKSDIPATQYNMKWSESAGLVKFDFLGLKTLTVIQKAIELLRNRGIEVDFSTQRYDDKMVFDFLATGQTLGVFQLEGQGMRDTLRRMVPTCLEDIIALISLYRPGPMENIPTYCDVKAGRQNADYLHPSLLPVLKETHGVIIYQEQVMQIAQILSGYSLGEADMLRRAMGKKLKEEMDQQRLRFAEGADKKGIDKSLAGTIFDLVQKFAGYGFNKSHAAAYAVISYQTAYLKAHYPVEFLVAAMTLDIEDTNKLGAYVQEAKRLGIVVNRPDINRSQANFAIENGEILYALGAVKNVGVKAMEKLVEIREEGGSFTNIYEVFERVGPRNLNKRAVENLAKAGAFDIIEPNRAKVCANADQLMSHASATNNEADQNQFSLFGESATPPRAPLSNVSNWGEQDRLSNEFAAMGLFLSGHPLDDISQELIARKTIFYGQIEEYMQTNEAVFRMAGVVRAAKERPAKRGGKFAWVTLSDPTGEYEVFVRPEDLEQARQFVVVGRAVSCVANAKMLDGDLKLSASRFDNVENIANTRYEGAKLYLENDANFDDIKKVTEAISGMESTNFGEIRLVFESSDAREIEVLLPGRYPLDIGARRALKSIGGIANIVEY
ncbi:MAG: DNA polymerase III subunit alpha [Caulobacterales bacterium]|nr:DNA polymerase III subunit alpha [Caulobacterales bacterium]MCA0373177.1 DNA polymerase III subunit alpha [Pseudomonadota bacterium]